MALGFISLSDCSREGAQRALSPEWGTRNMSSHAIDEWMREIISDDDRLVIEVVLDHQDSRGDMA